MSYMKPCPFCGGEPRVIREADGMELYHVGCFDPECRGNAFESPGYETEGDALDAWNHRSCRCGIMVTDGNEQEGRLCQ